MAGVVVAVAATAPQNMSLEVTSVTGPLVEGTYIGPLLELASPMRGALKVWPATSISARQHQLQSERIRKAVHDIPLHEHQRT